MRNQLIAEYLPHVKHVVNRIAMHLPPHIEIDDLVNAGIIGLIQAIERFDPSRDVKLITYAMYRIKGAVLSELRARDVLSRTHRRKVRELDQAYSKLEQKYGREARDREVATELGLDLDQFYQLKTLSSISFISFEEIGCTSNRDKDNLINLLMHEGTQDAYALTRLKEMKQATARAIEKLPEKEKLVISMYYVDELTMKEIGRVLDITESRVSQIHSRAIIHLRAKLRKAGLFDG